MMRGKTFIEIIPCNLATHLVWPLNSRQLIKPEELTGSDYLHHHTDLS